MFESITLCYLSLDFAVFRCMYKFVYGWYLGNDCRLVDPNMAARGAAIRDSTSAMFGDVGTNMAEVAL